MSGANLRKFILYDANGRELALTSESNVPAALVDKNGLELELRPPGNVPADSRVYGPDWLEYSQDKTTGSRVTVDQQHHEIHEGRGFSLVADVLAATSLVFAFKVGGPELPHISMAWKTETPGNVKLYRGATWTTGTGADVTPINALDGSANESTLQGDASGAFVGNSVVLDPTGLSIVGATPIYEESTWVAGQSHNKLSERVLSVGATYAAVITCASGGAWLSLDWYERTSLV